MCNGASSLLISDFKTKNLPGLFNIMKYTSALPQAPASHSKCSIFFKDKSDWA